MTDIELISVNEEIQHELSTLDVKTLNIQVASQLHQIWRNTRIIKDENGNNLLDNSGNVQYEDRWKVLDPIKHPEDKVYVEQFLFKKLKPNNLVKVEDGVVSINIAQMQFIQLAPSWQQENMDAAIVAVSFALDNYAYLTDPNLKNIAVEILGSAIHALWLSRPANAYARNTELGQRFGLLSREEQLKDNRHIVMAKDMIDFMVKDKKLSTVVEISNKLNNSSKR